MRKTRSGILFLFFALLACGPIFGLPPTTAEQPERQSTATAASSPTPGPAGTGIPETQTPSAAGYGAAGPWLMILAPDGLYVPSEDLSAVRQITFQHLLAPQDITAMPASAGGRMAYITSRELTQDLTLHVLLMPRGLAQTLPLVDPVFAPVAEKNRPGDPAFEAFRALFEVTSLAWSPDGNWLAFAAVLDAPHADLYLIEAERFFLEGKSAVRRLSGEPGQAIRPSWSPDGRRLVYLEVSSLGSGAGLEIEQVWTVEAGGGEPQSLYVPQNSLDETILGWLQPEAFVVHSRDPECGSGRLRSFDLVSRESNMLWAGSFNDAALDPASDQVLVAVDQFTADCSSPAGSPGLFLVDASTGQIQQLISEEAFLPNWSPPAGMFFARTADGVLGISAQGTAIDLHAPRPVLPLASPDGRQLAWATPAGLWIGATGQVPAQIFEGPVFGVAWLPDRHGLLFFSEDSMYRSEGPGFEPVFVAAGVLNRGLLWLPP